MADAALPADLQKAVIKLYGMAWSPPCCKVTALLHYYKVPFTVVPSSPHQKHDDLPDSSYGLIPKLVVDGIQINDSAVIVAQLASLLEGSPMTEKQEELEKRNNITGLLGALEKETASSYFGIVNAVSYGISGWGSTYTGYLVKPFLPYVAGFLAPLPRLAMRFMPHGRDGPSISHAKVYREALGAEPYFHGTAPGPLDISLYGGIKCFVLFGSPSAAAMLDEGGLREWYTRCDELYTKAGHPLFD